jgi:hypothetical protein
MRLNLLLLAALSFAACRAQPPRQVSCKPPLPFAVREGAEPPAPPRLVTLVKLPSGEVVEEVRR